MTTKVYHLKKNEELVVVNEDNQKKCIQIKDNKYVLSNFNEKYSDVGLKIADLDFEKLKVFYLIEELEAIMPFSKFSKKSHKCYSLLINSLYDDIFGKDYPESDNIISCDAHLVTNYFKNR